MLNLESRDSQNYPKTPQALNQTGQAEDNHAPEIAATDYLAWYERGRLLYHQQNFGEAIKSLNQALVGNPHSPEIYLARALAYHDIGDNHQALSDFSQAIILDPRNYQAYLERGLLLLKGSEQEINQAIVDLTKAITLQPALATPYYGRGRCFEQLKRYGQALNDYNKACELEANKLDFYTHRAFCHLQMQNYALAVSDCNIVLTQQPYHNFALQIRAICHAKSDHFSLAHQDILNLIALKPADDSLHYMLAASFARLGWPNEATIALQKAFSTQPDWYYQAIKEFDFWGVRYHPAIISVLGELPPGDKGKQGNPQAQEYHGRGLKYQKAGQVQEALADFTRAIALNPNDDKLYNTRAQLYMLLKHPELAIWDYQRAYVLDAKNLLPLEARGLVYLLQLDNPEEALVDFQKALEHKPYKGSLYYDLARAYAVMGHPDYCAQSLHTAIKLEATYRAQVATELLFDNVRTHPSMVSLLGDADSFITEELNRLSAETVRNEKEFGFYDQQTSYALQNLAAFCTEQNWYALALDYYQQAMLICENALGPNHLEVAEILYDLANIFAKQKKTDQAIALLERASTIAANSGITGDTLRANCLRNLANIYSETGKLDQALPLMQGALATKEALYGSKHQEVELLRNSLRNLQKRISLQNEPIPVKPTTLWNKLRG